MIMGNLVTMKKILTILAAACAIHCFCIATPMHGGDNTETFLSHSTMTNEQLREKLIMALDDMKAKAIEMGIQGVAAASVLNKGETVDWIGEMKVVGSPYNQKGGLQKPGPPSSISRSRRFG